MPGKPFLWAQEATGSVVERLWIPKGPPKTVTLDHDDYSAAYVGRTRDGRQFFLCFWPPWTSGDYDT
jgi:hypothetical protein